MLRRAKNLTGLCVGARDRDLGRVTDCFFDDESWDVRFLVVETGPRLFGRKGPRLYGRTVLIAPSAVERLDPRAGRVVVALTAREVERCPDVDAHPPVSRQREGAFRIVVGPPLMAPAGGLWVAGQYAGTDIRSDTGEQADRRLRSANEVRGYRVRALDGRAGRVRDFLIDDETFEVAHLVVDTRAWLGGRTVLVATGLVEFISWEDRSVGVRWRKRALKTAQEYRAPASARPGVASE